MTDPQAKVVALPTLKQKVSLVRCDGCGTEFEDIEAATHQDGYSEKGCPKGCRELTTPVYWPDSYTDTWTRQDGP